MRFCNPIVFVQKSTSTPLVQPRGVPVHTADTPLDTTDAPKLRDKFPFLNDPDCPVELQALVTRRITRYYEYSRLYPLLRACKDNTETADVAGKLIEAYLDNQLIFREMEYYQKYQKVLGRHPFFKHFRQLSHLRSMSVRDLIREQQRTQDNIWRIKSEMKRGNKPHLDERRQQKLQEYKIKLQEISRLLGE